MSSPKVDEVLFSYIAVAPHAVSLVLIQVNSGIQRASLLCEQIITRGRCLLFATGEGHFSGGTCYTKAFPLFPGTHSYCTDPTSAQVHASEC